MEGKTLLRVAVVVFCLAITAAGYQNSNGDNSEVVALASKAACADDGCAAMLGQTARSSFGHEYSFSVREGPGAGSPTRQVIVGCKRQLIFIGDWSCKPKARE